MAGLSNSIGPADADLVCRPVERGEIEAALRLILATANGLGADAQVLDFLGFCVERRIDTNSIWIAIHRGQIVWAMLPVVSLGRTMLIFTPSVLFEQTPPHAISQLSADMCEHYSHRGVQMAQLLIDPNDRPIINAYCNGGFDELAELVYLQKSVRGKKIDPAALPAGFSLKTYSLDTHEQFASVIKQSYEESLDCPALNGVREMSDVIAGHQATGEFDARMWWILHEQDQPVAVLMLARVPQAAAIELVYLGLTKRVRGRGIGDFLMQHALATTAADGRENLSLAVDSRNQPALRLYYRHGLRRIGSRVALLRLLNKNFSRPRISTSPAQLP
jgi:ribosomal protein S18 acetylase RimI-like enzyme